MPAPSLPLIAVAVLAGAASAQAAWALAARVALHKAEDAMRGQRRLRDARAWLSLLLASWCGWIAASGATLPKLLAACTGVTLLVSIAWVDWHTLRIPDTLLAAVLAAAVLQALWLGWPTPAAMVGGALFGGSLFAVLYVLGRAWLGPGALGLGDVKLAAVLGAWLGWPVAAPALWLGITLAGLAALWQVAVRRAQPRAVMAYGPYLALAVWLVWSVEMWKHL